MYPFRTPLWVSEARYAKVVESGRTIDELCTSAAQCVTIKYRTLAKATDADKRKALTDMMSYMACALELAKIELNGQEDVDDF